MPLIIDGTYALLILAGLLLMLAAWTYAEWRHWDNWRRHQRRVHRNLQRMTGRPR